jgi:V8-like Glu-specific endopeptidase
MLTISACGTRDDEYVEYYYSSDPEALDSTLTNLGLSEETTLGLGTLIKKTDISKFEFGIGLCTWFLIDKDHAVTNSHCISKELKNKKRKIKCGDYLKGVFRGEDGDEKRSCSEILHYSKIDGNRGVFKYSDYALIKLDKPVIISKYFKLSRSGIGENEGVLIDSMNHTSWEGGTYSILKKHQCIVKSSNFFKKITSRGTSPVTVFKEANTDNYCKTIGGNSGSPVLNQSNEVIGILHGGLGENAEEIYDEKEDTENITTDIGIITNFRCQEFNKKFMKEGMPKDCLSDSLKARKVFAPNLGVKNEISDIDKKTEEISARLPKYLRYKVDSTRIGNDFEISFQPTCILPLASWSESDLSLVELSPTDPEEKNLSVSLETPRLSLKIFKDYYGNNTTGLKQTSVRYTIYKFESLQSMEKNNIVDFKKNSNDMKLEVCSLEQSNQMSLIIK